ncbi:M20/M25/M40 family metallo-hydrolase [Actinoplanes sp. NEAU-A12]|uniref:M20/M25/M40 family metallo-hydrolase n=1 Tax=Actinoplanes sandaracinus TaxID=3045177 RepID=A0ABT6WTA2_9ACTN|nr:M20/M25/M40 family metallo-hydrolase [Actinoplanes sandaracinus]MDI6102982.1 M20/M25/M40 family metallo-hydrolase [Actinoplanes sandaracinus]
MPERPTRRQRVAALFAALAIAAAGVSALLPLRLPEAAGAGAPVQEFSAARARAHVERMAAQPHPTGSAAHAEVRRYLVDQLTGLGLRPQVQERTAARAFPSGAHLAGRVANVSATVPGTEGASQVLLVAHYDSVAIGPGATDDTMNVAAILEIARALRAAGPLRQDVVLLLTDAEEPGQLGAEAYLASGAAGDPTQTVVLNLEARGTGGPAVMFETGQRHGAVVPALAAETPFASSTSREIYRLLPNETDFTLFRDRGFTGLNFAVMDDSARYDTPLDDVANLTDGSLQDIGATVLSATRALADGRPASTTAGDLTYFSLFGLLVHYPPGVDLAVAGIVALGSLAALGYARRRGRLRLRAVATVAATVPVLLAVVAAVGWAAWTAMTVAHPHYLGFGSGDPYRPGAARVGLVVLAVAVCAAGVRLLRRRIAAAAVAAGVLGWFATLGVLCVFLLPGAAYLFLWPALFGTVGLAAAARLDEASPWRPLATTATALPAAALLTPLIAVVFPTLGLASAAVVLVPVALVALPALPAVVDLPSRRAVTAGLTGIAVVGAAVIGFGTARDGVDRRHPAQVALLYALDLDAAQASWLSPTAAGEPWSDDVVPQPAKDVEAAFPALYAASGYRHGPATTVPVPAPSARVVADERTGDSRRIRIRIGADGGAATVVSVYADTSAHRIEHAQVDALTLPGGENRPQTPTVWKWGVHLIAPGEPLELTITVRGAGALPLRLIAYGADVPAQALPGPRPETVTWAAGGFGRSLAARTLRV